MVVKSGLTILVKGVVDKNDKRVIPSKRTTATLQNERYFENKFNNERLKKK